MLADPGESGRLRNRIVEVSGTVFHPLGIPQQIEQYFRMILEKANATEDPFEQAFFIMVHIPYLQPFVDVNKRVSRL
ncbi:MAG: Fic family protein [Acidiferrobacteraceae bacterium]